MISQDKPPTLAILLGVERDAGGDNLLDRRDQSNAAEYKRFKTAAYMRFMSTLKGEDIDEQMAALDDYIELTRSD